MRFSDSHHFRRMVAGVCMVMGPLLALAAFAVTPSIHTGAGAQLASYAAHQDRLLISTLLWLASVALLLAGTLGLMHMMRERSVAYGHAGGALALLGLVALAAQLGGLMLAWQMVRDGVQASDVTAWHGVTHAAAPVIALSVVSWLGTVGFVVLAAGLYRARAVDWWMAATVAVGAVCISLAVPLASTAVGIAGAAILCAGLGSIGLMVVRETDAEWEHTPEYHGFRPSMRMG
jgi:hypothetical protein